jgi:hypothetical protein
MPNVWFFDFSYWFFSETSNFLWNRLKKASCSSGNNLELWYARQSVSQWGQYIYYILMFPFASISTFTSKVTCLGILSVHKLTLLSTSPCYRPLRVDINGTPSQTHWQRPDSQTVPHSSVVFREAIVIHWVVPLRPRPVWSKLCRSPSFPLLFKDFLQLLPLTTNLFLFHPSPNLTIFHYLLTIRALFHALENKSNTWKRGCKRKVGHDM